MNHPFPNRGTFAVRQRVAGGGGTYCAGPAMPPDDVDWPDDDWIVKNDMKSRSAVTDDFPSDSDIERAAVEVLRARMPFQQDPIRVTVENGQVSLEGFVAWLLLSLTAITRYVALGLFVTMLFRRLSKR